MPGFPVSHIYSINAKKWDKRDGNHVYARRRRIGHWKPQMEKKVRVLRESVIERRLKREVSRRGGIAFKFVSPGMAGVPDRLILLPDGHMAFVELKAPGEVPRPQQLKRKEQIESLGFRVYVIDGTERIGVVLDEILST